MVKTRQRLAASLERRLDDSDLIALLIDGIEVARQTVVVALGITSDGTKVPLGLAQGSTENAVRRVSLERVGEIVVATLIVEAEGSGERNQFFNCRIVRARSG